MGDLRFKKHAEDVFEKAFRMTDVEKAIRIIADLVDTSIKEEHVVKKYSEESGEPVEFNWKDDRKWDGKIWLDTICNYPYLEKNDFLYASLNKRIPPDKVIVLSTNIALIVIEHVPQCYESEGTTPAYIRFRKAT